MFEKIQSLRPAAHELASKKPSCFVVVGGEGFEPPKPRGQLVYSQSRLTTSVPTQKIIKLYIFIFKLTDIY